MTEKKPFGEKHDVEEITATLDDRNMIYLKIDLIHSNSFEQLPQLGITIEDARQMITHLQRIVDAHDVLEQFKRAQGKRIVTSWISTNDE